MDVDYTLTVLRKDKKLDLNQLKELTREELVDKVLQLQAHNEQLRNIITKQNSRYLVSTEIKKKKDFDFSKCKRVHVFFKLLYFGWDYQGFVVQEDTSATIEQKLMDALLKCKLIESRETCNYHRCGRTDKGVSAFSQVISITVRAADEGKRPLEYCKMLNRLLPDDIRITAWQPVPEKCSARFDCKSRTYKYFFPKADLDLEMSGIPSLGVPPMDPLHISMINVKQNSGNRISLNLIFTNASFSNLSNSQLKTKVDTKKWVLEGEFFLPYVKMKSDFEADGKIILLPVRGNGKATVDMYGCRSNFTLKVTPKRIKGIQYYTVTSLHYNILGARKMTMNFTRIIGNKVIDETINIVLNENWRELFETVSPSFTNAFQSYFFDLAKNVFNRVPADQVFPEKL